ncbi:MAG: DUF4249 domain-containing protein [Bacteroidetes bacterium]|nr:DUF4249 domain-containing protein [Bacteroidota bacterium]
MKRICFLLLVLVLLIDSCVDRVDYNAADAATQLVVDGSISDMPGPYTVKLSRTRKILDFTGAKTVSASKVVISDNVGNSEVLTEISQGTFQTSPTGIQGVMGREYTLRVETRDGNVYESSPEKITPAGSVDDIYTTFEQYQPLSGSPKYQFRVFANTTGEVGGNNYYRWKFTGTYKVETHPELRTVTAGEGRIPDPPACSGYTKNLDQVGPCTCCTCWADLINTIPVISDARLVSDGKFTNIEVGLVPVEYWTFFEKVQIQVEQISLSPAAYSYWKTVAEQKAGGSSLFQPAIGKAISNMTVKNGTGGVQGLFSAYSSSKKIIFLQPSDIPVGVGAIPGAPPPIAESCLAAFPYSSNQQPATW